MNTSRQKKVYQLVSTVQWIMIALTLLYTQLPHTTQINHCIYWLLILSVIYSIAYSKVPERIYMHPKFFLCTSLVYQVFIICLVLCSGGISSDLHWLFLLPILFISSYYGMKEGFYSAMISSVLLSTAYLFELYKMEDIYFLHILVRRLSVLLGTALFVGLFANEEIRERKEIEISHSLSQSFMKEPRIENILVSTRQKVLSVFNPDAYAMLLLNQKTNTLIVEEPTFGLNEAQRNALGVLPNPEHAIMKALTEDEPFISNNLPSDSRFDKNTVKNLDLRNLLVVGIMSRKKVIGALVIGNRRIHKYFRNMDTVLLKTIASQVAVHMERARLCEKDKHNAEEAALLFQTSKAISSTIDLEILLKLITKNTANLLGADASCLMLLDERTKELRAKAAYSLSPNEEAVAKLDSKSISICEIHTIKLGEGIPGWVAEKEKSILIGDLQEDLRFKDNLTPCRRDIRSMLSVPLVVKDKVIGVLNADSRSPYKFNDGDLKMLSTLSGQVAMAIHNAQLFGQLEDLYIDTLKAFIMAIEAKDSYTRGHSEGVATYALLIGEALGLSKEESDKLMRASLLHDIGKIGLKEEILLKPAKLTKEEYDIIKQHPSIGVQIIGSITSLQETVPIILHHHEHYDGNGYPANLKGESIPLSSRILAVADAYQAMTSDRPYRKTLDNTAALKELQKNAGSQFDPQIVETFLMIMKKPDIEEELRRIEQQFEFNKSLQIQLSSKIP